MTRDIQKPPFNRIRREISRSRHYARSSSWVGVVEVDSAGTIISMNSALRNLVKKLVPQTGQIQLEDIIDFSPADKRRFEQLFTSGTGNFRTKSTLTLSKSPADLTVCSIIPGKEGSQPLVYIHLQVTGRVKKTASAMDARFRSFFELSQEIILVSNPDNQTIEDVNGAFESFFNIPKQEVIGKNF
jgi:PAS domain-containing protein